MSIALVIFGLLSAGVLSALSAHREQARINEARQQLAAVREALIGFALAKGRLPCPAIPEDLSGNASSAGLEAPACAADCPNTGDSACRPEHGIVPWMSLGVEETDPWGNHLTYFVDKAFSNPLSQAEKDAGMRTRITLDSEARANIQDHAGHNALTQIPVIVVSHGRHAQGAYGNKGILRPGALGDEAENADADLTFINHPPDDTYDDQLIWLPATIIKARLVSVGKLP